MTDLFTHLATGHTHVARCWAVTRRDGLVHGFTDHDLPLTFDGITFRADAGMTARAIQQGTGLAVDNSEAMGALSDASITEADIEAGRYDGARVQAWLVNWRDVAQRSLRFTGSMGELRREGGAFHAELRGLTDLLNQPKGRIYQTACGAELGDSACRVDLGDPLLAASVAVEGIEESRRFIFAALNQFDVAWFERGRLLVETGAAAGLDAMIKRDTVRADGSRIIEVWEAFRAAIAPGDVIRLSAGCDKRTETCRFKFNNLINFQGFPDIPGEDWLAATPARSGDATGGSRR